VLDWTERSHADHIFGNLKGKGRWCTLTSNDYDSYLTDGWLEGDEENAGPAGERHIESYVVNEENGWTAQQLWGFALVDGQRYYVRRVVVTKGNDVLKVRLVYNRL